MRVRVHPHATPYLRLAVYHFDDTDPTEDPDSVRTHDITEPVRVARDGRWHDVSIDLTAAQLDTPAVAGNMVLVYAGTRAAAATRVDQTVDQLDVDDLAFVEWRAVADLPDSWQAFDFVRNASNAPVEATMRGRPLG